MKKLNIGIFLSLLLMVGLCSCGEQKSNTKLVLNEVLIENESNFQDDYGVHSAWIEIFNRSFGSADRAGIVYYPSDHGISGWKCLSGHQLRGWCKICCRMASIIVGDSICIYYLCTTLFYDSRTL